MIEFIYQTLTKLGYSHPLHPTLTHVPIGLVMGAFLFVLVALIFRRTNLAQSARHCSVCHLTDSTATKIGPGLKGVFKAKIFSISGLPVTDENVRQRIVSGGDKMPLFKHLKEAELKAIVDYLKTL